MRQPERSFDAFLAAVSKGDLAGLLAVLAPDVEFQAKRSAGHTRRTRREQGCRPGDDGRARMRTDPAGLDQVVPSWVQ
jgi:ketosteroid isomerase-like protein